MSEKNAEGWPRAYYTQSSGQSDLGIDLYVHLGRELGEHDRHTINRAMNDLHRDLLAESTRLHPDNIAWKADWLVRARGMFEAAGLSPIYVREVENQYCGAICCPHRVWLLVTTRLGVLKVGWRKSVMVVDWSESDLAIEAEGLFRGEDVTKSGKLIHAWGYDKATEYLTRLREHAEASSLASETR
jgi:hypothetical protein